MFKRIYEVSCQSLVVALRERFEVGKKTDWVPSNLIKETLDEANDDEKITGHDIKVTMSSAFHNPQVQSKLKKMTARCPEVGLAFDFV